MQFYSNCYACLDIVDIKHCEFTTPLPGTEQAAGGNAGQKTHIGTFFIVYLFNAIKYINNENYMLTIIYNINTM